MQQEQPPTEETKELGFNISMKQWKLIAHFSFKICFAILAIIFLCVAANTPTTEGGVYAIAAVIALHGLKNK